MDTIERADMIVARHVAGESLSAVGADYGLSRERARQIFAGHATPEQVKKANAAKPKAKPRELKMIAPRGEPRKRIHVPCMAKPNLSQKAMRAGVSMLLAGKIDIAETSSGKARFDLVVSEKMQADLLAWCDKRNMPIAAAVRGVIAYLEMENAK